MRVQQTKRQLLDIGEIGAEINAALPYRETVERALSRVPVLPARRRRRVDPPRRQGRRLQDRGLPWARARLRLGRLLRLHPGLPGAGFDRHRADRAQRRPQLRAPARDAVGAARPPVRDRRRRRLRPARRRHRLGPLRRGARGGPRRPSGPRPERARQRAPLRRHPPPGHHRPPDRSLQPAPLHEPRPRGDRAEPALPAAVERADGRHRPLQALQRPLRTRHRRPCPPGGVRRPQARSAQRRRLRSPRRRGVRDPAAQHAGDERLQRRRPRPRHRSPPPGTPDSAFRRRTT